MANRGQAASSDPFYDTCLISQALICLQEIYDIDKLDDMSGNTVVKKLLPEASENRFQGLCAYYQNAACGNIR